MVSLPTRQAVAGLPGPLGIIDRDALQRNIAALAHRAAGLPVRVASKSLRVPAALQFVLKHPGYQGILAFTVAEALALYEHGFRDIVVAYPSVDLPALTRLRADPAAAEQITVMVDSPDHCELLATIPGAPLRVCIDIDVSYRPAAALTGGRIHLGPRRSPVRTAGQAVQLAAVIDATPRLALVGLMAYEGLIAGVGNAGHGLKARLIRKLQTASGAELKDRRREIVHAVRNRFELEFVNGGGTGSVELSAAEGTLTEVAAGSGLFAPALFDHYTHFRHEPAAFFACPVVRKPGPGWVTVHGGGFIASGPVGADRLPVIDWPTTLAFAGAEGPGEVQTPLHGPGADALAVGDLVFFRHAKAGELAEHLNSYHVVSAGQIVAQWDTYRGKGWVF